MISSLRSTLIIKVDSDTTISFKTYNSSRIGYREGFLVLWSKHKLLLKSVMKTLDQLSIKFTYFEDHHQLWFKPDRLVSVSVIDKFIEDIDKL